MLVMVDNYDSFTYNLVSLLQQCGQQVLTLRNDDASPQTVAALKPDGVVLSPGPGTPNDAGHCLAIVEQLAGHLPILGVCLGHQVIGQVFGARVARASVPVHGKTSVVRHNGSGIFSGLPQTFAAMRYHSLMVQEPLPKLLIPHAWTAGAEPKLMALRHAHLPVWGVQFHPESVLTTQGPALLQNWVRSFVH